MEKIINGTKGVIDRGERFEVQFYLFIQSITIASFF